jgi:Dolichyl-phosphate-mannose-protein mannosyltransferase
MMTLISPKSAPYLLFAVLSVSFYVWFSRSAASPLWADEVITIELVRSASLTHLFSAVLGLDPTPPLYTGYGWFMLSHVVPGVAPELLLRITNAMFVAATIWILYLSIRHFFDRITAVTTVSAFALLERSQLEFLTLEVRTYAVFVLTTALAVYFSLRAIGRPSRATRICTAVSYCLLMSSHTFGIIYVVCIAACSVVVALAEGDAKLARNSWLVALPALVMFMAWLPVLRHQTQSASWISRPDLRNLMESTYIPNRAALLALLILAALITLWRRNPGSKAPMLALWWRSLDHTQKFVLLVPVSFVASTLAVWIFSKVVFPVFVPRYFFPNIVLHIIWLTLLVHFVFTFVVRSTVKYGLFVASALLTALSIAYRPYYAPNRVPCFDPARNTYLEDPFKDGGPVVALWSHTWLTRLNRPGGETIFLVDDRVPKALGAEYQTYTFDRYFVPGFATWLGKGTVTTTEKLLNGKLDFMVLDDDRGPWLKFVQLSHKLELTKLAEMNGCKLWRVRVGE